MRFFHPYKSLYMTYVMMMANIVDPKMQPRLCGTIHINIARQNDCDAQKYVGISILRWLKTVVRIMVAINTHDETINITSPEVTNG